jgi:hypothetical protein
VPAFDIRYDQSLRDASRRTSVHVFFVRSGDGEAILAVEFPDNLGRQWGLAGRANGDEIQRRAALACLKEHLSATGTLAGQHGRKLLLTACELPRMPVEWSVCQVPKDCPYERKECKHRSGKQGGYRCSAAEEGDGWGGRTTLSNCEACGLPSTDIACSNLVHPSTLSSQAFGRPWTRELWDAHCEVGNAVDGRSAAECVPGGRDCWIHTYQPEEAAQGVEPGERNLAAEALDMADTLNIIFRNQFGAELFTVKQFRTGRVLMGLCATEADLAYKLQNLGDLIDLMNSKELGEAQGVTAEAGSVNWLAALLNKVGQGDPAPVIRTLRDIRTLRKQLAAHSAATDHFVEACGRLGIDLPIADCEGAWYRVLTAFLEALRRLQGLLP